jgi:uncharacterized protein (TIGR03435 family)
MITDCGDGARNVEPVDTAGPDAGPNVFGALDHLGLQLEKRRMPLPVLMVEHVDQPSAN